MALKRIVKVGSITNLSDARYCAGMGVDMIGFRVIEGQQDYLPSSLYQEIKGWISGPKSVAEIYGITAETSLDKIIDAYQPDFLELSGSELKYIPKSNTIPLIVTGNVPINLLNELPIEYAIDSRVEKENDIPKLASCETLSELKSIMLDPTIKGIVLKGSSEARPGQKNYDNIADVLEYLEED